MFRDSFPSERPVVVYNVHDARWDPVSLMRSQRRRTNRGGFEYDGAACGEGRSKLP